VAGGHPAALIGDVWREVRAHSFNAQKVAATIGSQGESALGRAEEGNVNQFILPASVSVALLRLLPLRGCRTLSSSHKPRANTRARASPALSVGAEGKQFEAAPEAKKRRDGGRRENEGERERDQPIITSQRSRRDAVDLCTMTTTSRRRRRRGWKRSEGGGGGGSELPSLVPIPRAPRSPPSFLLWIPSPPPFGPVTRRARRRWRRGYRRRLVRRGRLWRWWWRLWPLSELHGMNISYSPPGEPLADSRLCRGGGGRRTCGRPVQQRQVGHVERAAPRNGLPWRRPTNAAGVLALAKHPSDLFSVSAPKGIAREKERERRPLGHRPRPANRPPIGFAPAPRRNKPPDFEPSVAAERLISKETRGPSKRREGAGRRGDKNLLHPAPTGQSPVLSVSSSWLALNAATEERGGRSALATPRETRERER
jgi:hypothetical protein